MGQEGKTASQLQIDIPANVFVCCEKWCCNPHLQCSPPPPPPPSLLPTSPPPPIWSLFSLCSESHPAIHFQHPKLPAPHGILTADDHHISLMAFRSHCIPGSRFLVAIETCLGLLFIAPQHLFPSFPCPSRCSI